jgi:hypothetical protein
MRKRKLRNGLTREESYRIQLVIAALDGRFGEKARDLARKEIAKLREQSGFGKPTHGNA